MFFWQKVKKIKQMKHWWKILSVLLVLYSLTVGMLVPLKTGIAEVSPLNTTTGEDVTLIIQGYNTNFGDAKGQIRAWLKVDKELSLLAKSFKVKSDNLMTATFSIPDKLPGGAKVKDATLILDSEVDGSSVLPSALFISQKNTASEFDVAEWSRSPIANLHEKDGMSFPYRNVLSETIRNLFYHVPLWFGMMIILVVSAVYSGRYLRTKNEEFDFKASAFTKVGILYGILGLVTGAIWAKHTWGAYWSWDVKQNMAAISVLIYVAYFVLRSSFDDPEKQARISAVYNIFAFAALIPLLFVIPRLTDSLHPGNGGNPGFGGEDLDNTMRMVFYPAIIGFTLLGVWMANLIYRSEIIENKLLNRW